VTARNTTIGPSEPAEDPRAGASGAGATSGDAVGGTAESLSPAGRPSPQRRLGAWRRTVSLGVVALLLVGAAAACGGDDDDDEASGDDSSSTTAASGGGPTEGAGSPAPQPLDEETSITITVPVAIEAFAPVYLADAMGEFEAENLDVELAALPANDGSIALSQGDAQLQIGGVNAAFLNQVNAGIELRWVANVHQAPDEVQEGLWVRNDQLDDDGEVPADRLREMQIAIGGGGIASTSALPVSDWAEEQGVHLSELQLSDLAGNDIALGLEQGSLDAGYVLSPAWVQVRDSNCCTLVTPLPPLSASTYTMSEDFIQDQPEVAAAIMRALARTVRTHLQGDYHADDEVVTALSEALEIPVETIQQSPAMVFDPDMGFDTETVERMQEIWIENDVLDFDEPLAVDDLVDRAPVEAALGG
jgi:NitT/TauT family transport system substrate-binding protein